jgi:histidinol dehydrogenase
MLKFINYNKKNSLNNLEIILNKRKFSQKNKTSVVKKIILDVKKNGDSAVLKYEKKFSKIKTKSKKINK